MSCHGLAQYLVMGDWHDYEAPHATHRGVDTCLPRIYQAAPAHRHHNVSETPQAAAKTSLQKSSSSKTFTKACQMLPLTNTVQQRLEVEGRPGVGLIETKCMHVERNYPLL